MVVALSMFLAHRKHSTVASAVVGDGGGSGELSWVQTSVWRRQALSLNEV